ncbi:MAG: hypothetical protein CNE95_03480 [Puniceicoccaceae bacterium MED-G30]|jgi:hypothetical protein|nr:MAG: hypothetical protein CNE95_03480 [Puniceicoccaceae bacterium MED-G30]|tara:strand:+ start:6626 stop:7021 length:396 start_codon:yes stop_codon:yes gene_type:complete
MHEVNRNSGNRSYLWTIGAVLLAASLLGGIVLLRQFSGGRQASLPESDFAEAPCNFSGNRYEYKGRIDRLLGYEAGVGRVLLTNSTNSESPVPLFIPEDLERFSPNPGQVFRFLLLVDGDGILHVESYEKL